MQAPTVVISGEDILVYRLCVLKAALKLEMMGMKRQGRSALSILRDMGFKGNRKQVLEAVETLLRENV